MFVNLHVQPVIDINFLIILVALVYTFFLYQGVSTFEREKRAKEALEKVGLGDKMQNLPTELSGGQQQRVAIARAIVTQPPLILADEPTGALDSATGKEVLETIKALHKEGKTVIIITHDKNVNDIAEKHIHIKDGVIESKNE